MTTAHDAIRTIWDSLAPLGPCTLPLEESRGRVLAEDVLSADDVPPFDNAAMDGFAVRSEDVVAVPSTLVVTREIAAGAVPDRPLNRGEAARIMTGGMIPAGCDAVVQQEWTESAGKDRVTVRRGVDAGHNIRKAGSDIAKGSIALRAGTVVRPQEIGLLASLGRSSLTVSRAPSVSVLATGNELVDAARPLPPGRIRDSNAPMLSALLRMEGCSVRMLGIARDDRDELRSKLAEGLASDMLLSSGGVSVGAYDLVGEILRELGVEIRFWKVNIKPGMPLLFGVRGSTAVFGLPGNPVSTMITYLKFVKPALRRLNGSPSPDAAVRLRAELELPVEKRDEKRHFVRGVLSERDGRSVVRPTGAQVSHMLTSLALANCLIILPEASRGAAAGEQVEVELL